MLRVLYAFLSVSGLGIVLGIGLAFAAKLLHVIKDERIEAVEGYLPGLNCGACGYAGCSAYAEAIVKEEAELGLCTPGGPATATNISEYMGVEFSGLAEKQVTQVICRGGEKTSQYAFEYTGVADCNALYALFGGNKVCKFGCLALGSCIKVCPVDAIDYDKEGLVWVDKEVCISCGKCVTVCPTGVMQWLPYEADYFVACSSTDKGGRVRKYCTVGCTGCKICEKKSPDSGYKVENFLSRIDYQVKGDRTAGAEACPPKCIINNEP